MGELYENASCVGNFDVQETIDGDNLAQNIDYMVDKTIQKISDEAAQKEREKTRIKELLVTP